jgi:hypothetical protein
MLIVLGFKGHCLWDLSGWLAIQTINNSSENSPATVCKFDLCYQSS